MGNLFRQFFLIKKRLSNLLLGNRQLFLCFFQFAPCIFKIVGNPFSKILDTGNRSLTGIAYIRPIQQSAPQNNIPFKRIEVHEKRKATIRTNFKLIFIFSTAFTYHSIKKGKCFARCRSLRIMLSIQHDGEILAFGLTQQRNVLRDSLNFLLIFPDAGWICQVNLVFQSKLFIAPRTTQNFQFRDPVFQFHLLCDHRIVGSGRLELCGRQDGFIHILTRAGNVFSGENLRDIAQFLLLNLPEIRIKCSFGYELLYHDFRVFVALPYPTSISLCNIRGLPRTVQMVNGDYLILNIHAGSQLAGAAD